MKKISKLVVALLIVAVVAVAMVACKPASNVSEIRIDDTNMPRTTFVQGQDLDLFGGYLTVVDNGEEELIPLDSSSLQISGYDKNKVGLQVLTISYGGKETTLTVRVSKRITVSARDENALKFFQGMDFVMPAGVLYVTDDEGNTGDDVPLGSEGVEIDVPSDFSVNPGKKEIGISYGGFSDTFEVEVFEIASRNFNKPSKRAYMSHDTKMEVSDGYILYKDPKAESGLFGGYEQYVYLTEDMIVEGTFNPSAATYEENYKGIEGNTDLTQEVLFSYAGFEYAFNIQIEFSNVSLAIHYGEVLNSEADWTDEEFEPSADQIQMALAAAETYFSLNDDERALFTIANLKSVMTIAAYHLYNTWLEGMEDFEDVLSLSIDQSTGTVGVSYIGDTYEKGKAAMTKFETQEFVDLCNINTMLSNILGDQNLAAIEFFAGYSIAAYCEVAVAQSNVNTVVSALDFTIDLYEALDGVNLADVAQYNRITEDVQLQIEDWYTLVRESYFLGYRPVYATVEAWRPGYFDIIFTYFYGMAESERMQYPDRVTYDTNLGLNRLWYIGYSAYLPEPLELFYTYAQYMYQTFATDSEMGGNVDASSMFYYMNGIEDAIDSINNGSNQLYKNLFRVMQFAFDAYVTEDEEGKIYYSPVFADQVTYDLKTLAYNYYKTGVYGMAEFDSLIEAYMPLVELYMSGAYITIDFDQNNNIVYKYADEIYTEVPKFMEKFMAATTGVQTMFLLHISDIQGVMDLDVEQPFTIFTLMLKIYYSTTLDEDSYAVMSDLMYAYECFLVRDYAADPENGTYTLKNFVGTFNEVKTSYNGLNSDQKAKVSFMYDYLDNFASLINNRTLEFNPITISDPTWNTKFNNMADIIGESFSMYYAITMNWPVYAVFLSTVARAEIEYAKLLDEINAVTDPALKKELINALQFKSYNMLKVFNGTYNTTLQDCFINELCYQNAQVVATGTVFGNTAPLLYYWNSDIAENFASMSEITVTMFRVINGFANASDVIGREDFDDVFKSFLNPNGNWTKEQKVIYLELQEIGSEVHYNVFVQAFWGYYSVKTGIAQSQAGDDAIVSFLKLVEYYNLYAFYLSANADVTELAPIYQEALNMFNTAYGKLDSTQKAAFDAEFGSYLNTYRTAPRR